ncbi:TRAP transporter small permease [Oceanimonas sp. CHS3-5]|uniref:TRAP transporter small permease subunit n=1 Tax=Oceanimonas sp. CHS3-5 TaxID=3068186 RepID=UPI00273D4DA2|nr:TRAP transporter small permease [Oceanimonas sp. CHS3-5]MDP5291814.1 TRAP transporter small permease [Oceanimonas sp. CHS3-5]
MDIETGSSLEQGPVAGFLWFASFVARAGAVLAAVLMAAMTLHVMLEIVLRAFFNTSTFVLDEFVGYGVAAMTFMTLGHALETGSLIRVNILLARIRSQAGRLLVELTCAATALVLSGYIAGYFWKSVLRNFTRGATSETIAEVPLWIPEAFVLIGLVIFMIQLLAYMVRLALGQSLPVGQE